MRMDLFTAGFAAGLLVLAAGASAAPAPASPAASPSLSYGRECATATYAHVQRSHAAAPSTCSDPKLGVEKAPSSVASSAISSTKGDVTVRITNKDGSTTEVSLAGMKPRMARRGNGCWITPEVCCVRGYCCSWSGGGPPVCH